jgi:hypothetical protein
MFITLSLLGNGSVKIPLSLLGKASVKSLPRQTHATEELLDASLSMWSVSYQGKQVIGSSQNFLLELNNTNKQRKREASNFLSFCAVKQNRCNSYEQC